MSGLTATTGGDAAAFQERYQRLLQELAEAFVNSLQQEQRDDVLLIDDKEIVYGDVNGVFVNHLNPEKTAELKQVLQTPAGGTVEGATAKAMYVDGKEVLRSDESGQVLVNEVIENPALQVRLGLNLSRGDAGAVVEPQGARSAADDEYLEDTVTWDVPEPSDLKEDDLGQVLLSPEPIHTAPEVTSQERLTMWREALSQNDPQGMRSAVAGLDQETKTNLYRQLDKEEIVAAYSLAIAVGLVEESSSSREEVEREVPLAVPTPPPSQSQPQSYDAVAALAQSVSGLSPEIQQQLAEPLASMQQARQTTVTQPLTPERQEFIEQRLQEPASTTWWEGVKHKAMELFQGIRDRLQENSAAVAIKDLYDEKFADGRNGSYEMDKYSIAKRGSTYTLKDEDGRELMCLQSGPAGLILMEGHSKLADSQRQDLDQLVRQRSKGREPTGAFAAVGTEEAQQFERINRIARSLTNYAARCGKEVHVAGNDYTWKANPNGSIQIEKTDAPQEEKLLLIASGGSHVSKMSERDLKHFETTISFMEKSPQSQQKVKAGIER